MKLTNRIIILAFTVLSLIAALYAMSCIGFWISLNLFDGGFSRSVAAGEQQLRTDTVAAAKEWLGTIEGSDLHQQLLQVYNSQESLPRGYEMTLNDNWCAAFASTVAINCGNTDIIPPECGCERQIELWDTIGHWQENDNYLPLPGDYIYYDWNNSFNLKDNTGWADHVGIVVGTSGPFIKVIEGNKDDMVTYRIIHRGHYQIRGYGLPDYASKMA